MTTGIRPDQQRRILSAVLALLLALQLVWAGLAPQAVQAAPTDLPLQLQEVCHGVGTGVQLPGQDVPDCPLPCCMLCCGSLQGGAWAPPMALGLALRVSVLADPFPRAPAAVSFKVRRQLLRPPLRGPPLMS